jgi:hypothetical protein
MLTGLHGIILAQRGLITCSGRGEKPSVPWDLERPSGTREPRALVSQECAHRGGLLLGYFRRAPPGRRDYGKTPSFYAFSSIWGTSAQKRRASAMHRACPVCEALNQSMVSVRVVVLLMEAVTESCALKVRV